MNCKYPNCERATVCSICGKKLCSEVTHQTSKVEAHFRVPDKCGVQMVVCVECHDKGRK
jgi:hypothetical protein